jgi:hypothetical protein
MMRMLERLLGFVYRILIMVISEANRGRVKTLSLRRTGSGDSIEARRLRENFFMYYVAIEAVRWSLTINFMLLKAVLHTCYIFLR